jgi:hypothetical protein
MKMKKYFILIVFCLFLLSIISYSKTDSRFIFLGTQELQDKNYNKAKDYFYSYIRTNKKLNDWNSRYYKAYALSLISLTNEKILNDELNKIAELASKALIKNNDSTGIRLYKIAYKRTKLNCDSLYNETKLNLEQAYTEFKELNLQNPDNSEMLLKRRIDSLNSLKIIIDGLGLVEPDELNISGLMDFLKIISDNKLTAEYIDKALTLYAKVTEYSERLDKRGGFIEQLWYLSDVLKIQTKNEDCFKDEYIEVRTLWDNFQSNKDEYIHTGFRVIIYDINPIVSYNYVMNYYDKRENEINIIETKLQQLIDKIKSCR